MSPEETFSKLAICPHQVDKVRSGIAIVSIGNPLRHDDGIAFRIVESLSPWVKEEVCCFNLETYSQFLIECIAHHEVAVIVDATSKQNSVGDVGILDLNKMLESHINAKVNLRINSCHSFAFSDELKLAQNAGRLPDKLFFFGIEIADTTWGQGLSQELELKVDAIRDQLESFLKSIFLKTGI